MEQSPVTPCNTSSSPSSVTTQPTPRVDILPAPITITTPETTASSPPSPDPEPDPELAPSPSKTEDKAEATEGTELKHRAPKKDLLEIDRFTICGNRIDWQSKGHWPFDPSDNHSGEAESRRHLSPALIAKASAKQSIYLSQRQYSKLLWTWTSWLSHSAVFFFVWDGGAGVG